MQDLFGPGVSRKGKGWNASVRDAEWLEEEAFLETDSNHHL